MINGRKASFDQVSDLLKEHDQVIVDLATDPEPPGLLETWTREIREHNMADRAVVIHNNFEIREKSAVYLPVWMLAQTFYDIEPWHAARTWNWCSINGGTKYHRLETARFFYENFSASECLLTCAFNSEHAEEYIKATWADPDYAQRWLNLLPIRHPAIDTYDPNTPQVDLDRACRESCVNCVTETTMYAGFISEKTAKPLRAGQFFVLAAAAGTVQQLRSWGFDVFDDVFENHAYDLIADRRSRLQSMFDLVLRVRDRDWPAILHQYRDRLQQNQRRLASTEFRDHIMRPLRRWSKR
jgi:hypothetical protein